MTSYRGATASSLMKQQVKEMGGDVDVDLRFSIRWNSKQYDPNDLDAHCTEPGGNEIYYSKKRSLKTGGWLDVDIINPKNGKPAVENIQFKTRQKWTKAHIFLECTNLHIVEEIMDLKQK